MSPRVIDCQPNSKFKFECAVICELGLGPAARRADPRPRRGSGNPAISNQRLSFTRQSYGNGNWARIGAGFLGQRPALRAAGPPPAICAAGTSRYRTRFNINECSYVH
jgi:hypothetical protein